MSWEILIFICVSLLYFKLHIRSVLQFLDVYTIFVRVRYRISAIQQQRKDDCLGGGVLYLQWL